LDDGFQIEQREDGGHTVLTASGELDLASSPKLRAAIAQALIAGADGAVLLDLGGLSFCDSSGMRELLLAYNELQKRGIALSIVPPEDQAAREVFRISKLDELLPFVATS
jgi:anti-sigma B factor antagonist